MTKEMNLESIARDFSEQLGADVATLSFTRANPIYAGDKHWIGYSKEGLILGYRFRNGIESFVVLNGDRGMLALDYDGQKVEVKYQNPLMENADRFLSASYDEATNNGKGAVFIEGLKRLMEPYMGPYDKDQALTLSLSGVSQTNLLKTLQFLTDRMKDIPATQ